jgi:site-specific recombinase XerD
MVENEMFQIEMSINAVGIEFEQFTHHCFQHIFVIRAIENGLNLHMINTILNYSTLSMAMDLYLNVLLATKSAIFML